MRIHSHRRMVFVFDCISMCLPHLLSNLKPDNWQDVDYHTLHMWFDDLQTLSSGLWEMKVKSWEHQQWYSHSIHLPSQSKIQTCFSRRQARFKLFALLQDSYGFLINYLFGEHASFDHPPSTCCLWPASLHWQSRCATCSRTSWCCYDLNLQGSTDSKEWTRLNNGNNMLLSMLNWILKTQWNCKSFPWQNVKQRGNCISIVVRHGTNQRRGTLFVCSE